MKRESTKSFVTYYLQSLNERTRREKSGTRWGIDWVVYNLGLAKFGKPVRLPFMRSGESGFPKSKVEAEFGVDLAFLSDDGYHLTIFVLKDEPLTNKNWTANDFDRDLRMAMAPDLEAEGLGQVKAVTIVLAYNKDDQQNGIEAYDRLVNAAPQTLRDDISLRFLRWNLSELVAQTIEHVLSPSLFPERFFGQLSYIAAEAADFLHGSDAWEQQLIPNWKQFINDVLSETDGDRGAVFIPVALIILRQNASSNPSVETGWIDLIEWAAIALWRNYLKRAEPERIGPVRRFWDDFYIAELMRFYSTHIDDLTTEQAVDQVGAGSFLGAIAAAYVSYWHVGRLGILATSMDSLSESEARLVLDQIANWTSMLVDASPAVFRPVLDIQHVEFFLLVEVFRRAGRTDQIINMLVKLVERLFLRRIGHGALPFLDGGNSLENVFEQIVTNPDPSLLLTQSSFFVLMLLELCCGLPEEWRDQLAPFIHRKLVLGVLDDGEVGDRKPLDLMSWLPPADWASQVFESHRGQGQSVSSGSFADTWDASAAEILQGVRLLVSKMREEESESPLRLPADIPLSAAILGSLRYGNPLPPELWRQWAFPTT